jgi:predicted O-methyltransferase YrrM
VTGFIADAMRERTLGLALHYPLLHAAVVGLGARSTFEFGAGGSTRVILEALDPDGSHHSVSTESREAISNRHGMRPDPRWLHWMGRSEEVAFNSDARFDLVLHDGAHDAATVAHDIARIWPKLRRYGLLLVHDSQHSYVGAEVRAGLHAGLRAARFTSTTLPYGFGLTIVRREDGDAPISPARPKATSPHLTVPTPVWGLP